ncbi:MarR family winged helix-turn-helix transcriptional regulator [Actinospongicola halichondriae]|uniref:MarR family winged helix-turn-helix transcriptional regulator n=1 Tax=Actinospongicola halichondriae TaxID=3236844 RepID=UPI003D4306CE
MAVIPESDIALAALDDPRVEAFGMLLETHNELVTALANGASEGSLPVPWLGVLIRLARTPDHRLRMTELARDMTMSTSGLTRLIDRVETAGHVERERCPEDRRGLWAVLTPAGLDVVMAAAPGHLADLDHLIAGALGHDELVTLTDLLRRVRNHVRGVRSGTE